MSLCNILTFITRVHYHIFHSATLAATFLGNCQQLRLGGGWNGGIKYFGKLRGGGPFFLRFTEGPQKLELFYLNYVCQYYGTTVQFRWMATFSERSTGMAKNECVSEEEAVKYFLPSQNISSPPPSQAIIVDNTWTPLTASRQKTKTVIHYFLMC